MDYLAIKNKLDQQYRNLDRNDLLWIMALGSKATFDGPFKEYFEERLKSLKSITPEQIKSASFVPITLDYKDFISQAKINGVSIVRKTTKEYMLDPQSGYIYEAFICKYFFDYMLKNNITPNLPFYYRTNIGKVDDDYKINLFTEKMDGTTLKDFLKDNIINADFFKIILFQIVYTLLCFQQMGIRHNDLHTSNIFIDTDIKGVIKYYINDNVSYTVPITNVGLVKIFDMDFASVDCSVDFPDGFKDNLKAFKTQVKKFYGTDCQNPKTQGSYVESLGIGPVGKNIFDLFIALCTQLIYVDDDETREFIYRIFDHDDFDNDKLKFPCRNPNVSKNPQEYKTMEDVIKDPYFDVLKYQPMETENVFRLPKAIP